MMDLLVQGVDKRTAYRIPLVAMLWSLLWWGSIVCLTIMITYASGKRSYLPYGQYAFFVGSIVLGLISSWAYRGDLFERGTAVFFIIFFSIYLAFVPSALAGMTPGYGIRLLSILALTTIPFMVMGRLSINRSSSFLWPIFLASLICAIGTVILQVYGPFVIGSWKLANHLHVTRWSFLFNEANNLGAMMAIGVSAALCVLMVIQHKGYQALMMLSIIFMLYVFLETNSRAALFWIVWSVSVIGLVQLYVYYQRLRRPVHYWSAVAVITGVIFATIAFLLRDEISSFMRLSQDDISSGRIQIWKLYLSEIGQHPLLGFGFGSTGELLKKYYPHSPLNIFIGLSGEAGLLGAVPFFIAWGYGLVLAVKSVAAALHKNGQLMPMAIFSIMVLGGFALQQNGEWTVMRVSPFHCLFFFALAAAFSLRKSMADDSRGIKAKRIPGS